MKCIGLLHLYIIKQSIFKTAISRYQGMFFQTFFVCIFNFTLFVQNSKIRLLTFFFQNCSSNLQINLKEIQKKGNNSAQKQFFNLRKNVFRYSHKECYAKARKFYVERCGAVNANIHTHSHTIMTKYQPKELSVARTFICR